MENHNVERKIAVINDVTGFGKCGSMVSLPVISAMGMQCCVVPTSLFSNHTAYSSFFMEDYTSRMEAYIDEWKKLGLEFDGILTGFYGSERQIDIVKHFINEFSKETSVIIVDPIMGDDGKRYSTYTEGMCRKMAELVCMAHIITPNVTEACILTDTVYKESWEEYELQNMCEKLYSMGPHKIVISGIERGDFIANYIFEDGSGTLELFPRTGQQRCGTGDIFSAIVAAGVVNGMSFAKVVRVASEFIGVCIAESDRIGMPLTDGVCFEKYLGRLCCRND